MATLRDIARHAGVSTATVSHVVNESAYVSPKLRERVLKAVREFNYQPNAVARMLRTSQSKTVGIFVPDITDPFFPALVRGAEDVLTHSGYTLLIGNSDNDQREEERYYRSFLERRVDGLLAVVASDQTPPYLDRHDHSSVPIVFADRAYTGVPSDLVTVDDIHAGKLAASHLIEMGYKRISTITGPQRLANVRDRLEGYRRALREAGFIEQNFLIREANFDVNSGYKQALELLQLHPRPDAIFAQNALMTLGAFRAIQECNILCPEQIGLISFATQDWFELVRPRISAVAHDSYDIGATAAELLLKRMTGKLSGDNVRRNIPIQLVVRESTSRTGSQPKVSIRNGRPVTTRRVP